MRQSTLLGSIAVPLVLALALSGCGGAKQHTGVASAGGSGKASASAKPVDLAEQQRRFTQCMRSHGMDMPDPVPAGSGGSGGGGGGGIVEFGDPAKGGPDPGKVDAAMKACREFLPNGGEPPKMDPAQVEKARQFSKCVREHGFPNFPDPDANGMMKIEPGNGFDLSDPKFQAAQKDCEKFMPVPSGGAGVQRIGPGQ
ncbi:MAG: hypothetical protein AUI14_03750 [Actinobacteria bacterium 13_2_20CM_2_71_6]|nr:MAG: hypothetical protein AUI14_03750 [Actinobacteria bacterium 13_2_20CM_2_71_6]